VTGRKWPISDRQSQRTHQLSLRDPKQALATVGCRAIKSRHSPKTSIGGGTIEESTHCGTVMLVP